MDLLKSSFKAKADKIGAEIKEMLKEHGNKKIGEVTLSQAYSFSWLYHPGITG